MVTLKKFFVLITLLLIWSNIASAHESRPLVIKIIEEDTSLIVEIYLPNTVQAQNFPFISINDNILNKDQKWSILPSGFRQKFISNFTLEILRGQEVKIEYPLFNPVITTIVSATFFGEEEENITVIPPDEHIVHLPIESGGRNVKIQYTQLGISHIWAGIDHLLFIICLLIISGFSKKLFLTITGFTIAHSITLILSTLGVIRLPIPPIEATIALSIVFLCYEIIHHHDTKNSLTYRFPILVSSSFGLLHGLGFAAVLGEIGLPRNHSFEALLFFNIGVELGQVLFIIATYVLFFFCFQILIKRLSVNTRTKLLRISLRISVYLVGILASYWMFDRIWV